MLIYVQRPEVGVVEESLGLQIHRRLSPALVAQRPLGIDEAPEGRTCELKRREGNGIRFSQPSVCAVPRVENSHLQLIYFRLRRFYVQVATIVEPETELWPIWGD